MSRPLDLLVLAHIVRMERCARLVADVEPGKDRVPLSSDQANRDLEESRPTRRRVAEPMPAR